MPQQALTRAANKVKHKFTNFSLTLFYPACMALHLNRTRIGRKILFFAAICGGLGALGVLRPATLGLNVLQSKIHTKPVSGEIVLIGVDSASIGEIGRWPWPRDKQAELLKKIDSYNPKAVYVDIVYQGKTTAEADQSFRQAIEQMHAPIKMAVLTTPGNDGSFDSIYSHTDAIGEAESVAIFAPTLFGHIWSLPTTIRNERGQIPSIAASIAKLNEEKLTTFRINYNYDPNTIATFAAKDVLEGSVKPGQLKNKTVILGVTEVTQNDMHLMPGWGKRPGSMFQLLGAETLMDGVPQSWGWIYFFLFAAGMCAILLTRQGLRLSGPVAGAASLLILATSSWLTTIHIINDPLPAIALIASVGIYITRQKAALLRSQRQVETGFSDMTGYSVKEVTSNAMFIAASLQRMETKRGYVLADDGVKIMKEVGRRLSTVIDESQLTHNKEQQFLWEMPQITTSELAAHLEGLRRLFGEPLVIDGRKIDVDIHFGIDRDTNSNIRRRMEKALNASIIARESQATFKIATTAAFDDHLKTHFASEFDAAIANGDVTCLFEAQPELVGGRIKSAEIALNWIHPAHGEIAKKKLFELARTSGNLDKVSLYLCDKAVNHAAELARLQPGFQLSLKISIQVVLGEAFKAWVRGYIQQENCRPNNIMFDIIDLHAHQNDRAVQLAVRELQQHNFRVGIGNFGITNGDIDLLNIFEPDGIFLSKSFAGELLGTTSNQFYAEAALRIAQASNIISTADGIDDREVLTELRKRGCACGMGKIISNPLVFNNFIETHIRQSDKKFG